MAAPVGHGAARSPRRRPRLRTLVALALLLLLIGRGLRLAGDEPAPAGGRGDGAAAVPVPAVPANAAGVPVSPPSSPPPAAPAPLAETSTASSGSAAGSGEPTVDADRFACLGAAIEVRTHEGRLGEALAVLRHARSLPLDGAQQAVLVAHAQALETALAAACARFVECLCQGRALAARGELLAMAGDHADEVVPAVDSAMRAVGLAGGVWRAAAVSNQLLPLAKPLARGREVRLVQATGTRSGTVIDSRSEQVTLRVATPRGFAFPSVPSLCCEPVQASADEAAELGLLALREGEVLVARLWLAVAQLRSGGALGERGELLARRLP